MNERHTINNTTQSFLDWCNQFKASPLQVRAQMSMDMALEAALQSKTKMRIVLIAMNGQTRTLTDWCGLYGIKRDTVKARIEAGYTLEEAFETPLYQPDRISKSHKSNSEYSMTKFFLSWCEDYGADPLRVRADMSTGFSLEYALSRKRHPKTLLVCVEGQTDVLVNMCKRYGKAQNTIRRRVSAGMTLEDAFRMPPFKQMAFAAFLAEGTANEQHTITKPLTAWCDDYDQDIRDVRKRLKDGKTLVQALMRVPEQEIIICNTSVSGLCRTFDIDPDFVTSRLSNGVELLEIIKQASIYKSTGHVPIHGEKLKSIRQKKKLSQPALAARINAEGMLHFNKYTIQALERGDRGISEPELQALCSALDICGRCRWMQGTAFLMAL